MLISASHKPPADETATGAADKKDASGLTHYCKASSVMVMSRDVSVCTFVDFVFLWKNASCHHTTAL